MAGIKTVHVVLPVFNEEKALEGSVEKLLSFLKEHGGTLSWRITIADNGSTDATQTIGLKIADKYDNVKYMRIQEKGRGIALRKAWSDYDADVSCYMDIDLSTDLMHLNELVDAIAGGYNMAFGTRFAGQSAVKRSLKREILSHGYNLLARILLSTRISDLQCGFKALDRKAVREILPTVKDNKWFFDSELLIRAEKGNYLIKEIPVKWTESSESKVKIITVIVNYTKNLLKLRSDLLI